MTDYAKRLAEIEARASAATKGPWSVFEQDCECWITADVCLTNREGAWSRSNGSFVAHARDDVPWLLAQLRAVSAALVAFGIPDDGTPLPQRIQLLAEKEHEEARRERREDEPRAVGAHPAGFCGDLSCVNEQCIEAEYAAMPQGGHMAASAFVQTDKGPALVLRPPPDGATEGDPLAQMRETLAGLGHDPEKVFERLKDPAFREAFNGNLGRLAARYGALGDKLDAFEHADPPTAPPDALVREYREVGQQLSAAHKAALGRPRINVLPVEPLSTGTTLAFVDGPGHHGVDQVPTATYPESPRGASTLKFRQEYDISLGDLARALCIGAVEMSGIERGSKTTDDAGWQEITTQLFLLGSGKKAEERAE